MTPRTFVIAGGGFAGTTLSQRLMHRLPAGWQLVLLSDESTSTFNPMLAEVVGAAVSPEHVIVPIRSLLHGMAAPQPRSHPHPQPISLASPDTSADASLTR